MVNPFSDGYWAIPETGRGPGVLLLHAWWGLNPFFKDLCQRLAREGFVVFAPDLYHGQLATSIAEAKLLRSKLNQKKAYSDMLGMLEHLSGLEIVTSKKIAVIGFSIGARFALELSAERSKEIGAVIVFYGTSMLDYSSAQAAYLGHYAERDDWVALSGVKKLEKSLRAANRPVTFHVYEGTGHWFFENDQAAYVETAAQLAWRRSVDFLKLHLID